MQTIKKDYTKLIASIGFAIFAVTIPYALKFSNYTLSTQTSDWGAFGSYVGGILSPLFAVGSLYYVVKTFRQQSFETTFNLLLEQHNSLADTLSIKRVTEKSTDDKPTSPIEDTLEELGPYWLSTDVDAKKSLNDNYEIHKYVRVVYQILKFIDENCPSDKFKYSRIFKYFISNDLNLILAMNCSQVDSKGQISFPAYKHLIEQYHLLEHLILQDLAKEPPLIESSDPTNLVVIAGTYNPTAFGDGANIKKALRIAFTNYHESISSKLWSTSECVKSYENHHRFYNHSLERLSKLLEKHVNLDMKASKDLIGLNQEALDLINLCVSISDDGVVTNEFKSVLAKLKHVSKQYVGFAEESLREINFYNESKFNSSLEKFEKTTPLHQYLKGITKANTQEFNDVYAKIEDTLQVSST